MRNEIIKSISHPQRPLSAGAQAVDKPYYMSF